MESWTGPNGIPSKMTELTTDDIPDPHEYLLGRSCGAWVGKAQCPQPAVMTCQGGTPLQFASYLSIAEKKGLVTAAFCPRHRPLGTPGEVTGRIIADIDPDVLKHARQEMTKFFRLSGQPPCPRPNLLWPEPEMPAKPGGRYSEAIEEQLSRLDFVKSAKPQRDGNRDDALFLRAAITALTEGDTYYWAPDVCKTIAAVGSSMPQTWAFDVDSLPSPVGFFYFKGGLWWRVGDQAAGVDSICWRRGLDQNQKPAAAVGMFMLNASA